MECKDCRWATYGTLKTEGGGEPRVLTGVQTVALTNLRREYDTILEGGDQFHCDFDNCQGHNFCDKRKRRLRLILDCRSSNRNFVRLSCVSLLDVEGFGNIERRRGA